MSWTLDLSQPVELGHPHNRGRLAWLYGVAGSGGRLPNIMPGDRFHAGLVGGPIWSASSNGGFGLAYDGSAQYAESQFPLVSVSSGLTVALTVVSTVASGTTGAGRYPLTLGRAGENLGITWTHFSSAGYSGTTYMIGNGTYPVVPWATKPVAGARTRIVSTWDGTTLRAYLNGALQGSAANSQFGSITSNTVSIGAGNVTGPPGQPFPGLIEDVAISSRAWSLGEVLADNEQSLRGYRTTDSPLRWIRGTTFGLPLGGTPTTITPAPLTLRITPVAPAVRVGTTIAAPTIIQRLTPVAPTVRVGTTLAPPPLSLRVSRVAPSIRVGTTIAPSPITQRITLVAPAVRVGTRIAPPPLSLRLTPIAPAVSAGVAGETNVLAPTLALRITPIPPAVRVGTRITPPPLALRLSPVAPSVRVGTRVTVSPLTLRLSLVAPTIIIGSGSSSQPRIHPVLLSQYRTHSGLKAQQRANALIAKYLR